MSQKRKNNSSTYKSIIKKILGAGASTQEFGGYPNKNRGEEDINEYNALSSQIIHFDTRALTQDRYSSLAIRYQLEYLEKKFPKAGAYYLLTDQKDPMLSGLKKVTVQQIINIAKKTKHKVLAIAAYNYDDNLEKTLNAVSPHKNIIFFGAQHLYPASRFLHTDESSRKALKLALRKNSKTSHKVTLGDYENLIQALSSTRKLKGDYVEIGVYKGNSAIVALEYMKQIGLKRKCYFIDTYEGFKYDSANKSQDAYFSKTHSDTSAKAVRARLKPYKNYSIIKSNVVRDRLDHRIKNIAVANIDVDIYEATISALKKIHRHIVPGGIIIVEDYGHTPLVTGGFMAVKEFLSSNPGKRYTPLQFRSGQMFLIRHN